MKIRKSLGAGGVIWLRRAGIAGRCTKGASLWLGQPLTQSRVDIVVRLQLRCGKSCKTRNGRPDENEIVFRNNGYKMRERRLLLDKNRHFIPLSQLSKKEGRKNFHSAPHSQILFLTLFVFCLVFFFWPSLWFWLQYGSNNYTSSLCWPCNNDLSWIWNSVQTLEDIFQILNSWQLSALKQKQNCVCVQIIWIGMV